MRYQHASEIRADLERLKQGTDSARLTTGPRRRAGLSKRWKTALFVTVALGLGVTGYLYSPRASKLTDKDTIVFADFANNTGDSDFDQTLRRGLAVSLGESPFLSLVPDERIRQTLHLMGRSPDSALSRDSAREVCERTFSAAVVQGSISRLGSKYVLGLTASNCRSGEVLEDQQVQVARKEDVLNALGELAGRFRRKAGESLASVREHRIPLADGSTPSLEAWKLYADAWKVGLSGNNDGAVPLLQRAIEIDPRFAMAYAFLGRIYGDMWEPELASASLRKAYRVPGSRERAGTLLHYAELLYTGNRKPGRGTTDC